MLPREGALALCHQETDVYSTPACHEEHIGPTSAVWTGISLRCGYRHRSGSVAFPYGRHPCLVFSRPWRGDGFTSAPMYCYLYDLDAKTVGQFEMVLCLV